MIMGPSDVTSGTRSAKDDPSRRVLGMLRYWRIGTGVAVQPRGVRGRSDWEVARRRLIDKLALAPSGAPSTHTNRRLMCPQTSFKEACMHASTIAISRDVTVA